MKTLREIKAAIAIYRPGDHVVNVKVVVGAKTTVRMLLNPNLPPGMAEDQIYANYASIPALDKKEVQASNQISVDLDAGDKDPPFRVAIATEDEVRWVSDQGAEVLFPTTASHAFMSDKVIVSGEAGANDTVRALLNPTLPAGMGDDQVFNHDSQVPALDKKEKPNAGSFRLELFNHGVGPNYTVLVVTNVGDSTRPPVTELGGPE
jgi:hypothetical protein